MQRVMSGDDIIQGSMGRGKPLLGEYLAEGETLMLYAPTGQGKTVNALMMGIAFSTGTEFYRWTPPEPMPVLFVEGGELTATGISERMRKIYQRKGIAADPNFHLMAPTKQKNHVYDITDPMQQLTLLDYVNHYGIKVVIFDNYNSLRKEADNEFQCWRRLEDFLTKLKNLKVASVVVHHTNKEGQKQSGAQRKADYCDVIIRIQKSILSTNTKKYIEMEMEKFRWGEELPIQLTELVFRETHLDLVPADYEQVLADTIRKDILSYGLDYVNKKFRFLGYKLYHYLPEGGSREEYEEQAAKKTPRDFF